MGAGQSDPGERPRARALAGVIGAGQRAVPLPWRASGLWPALGARLAADLAAEAHAGRLVLWLPVAFTAGTLLYFSAAHEPSLIATVLLALTLAAVTVASRRRPVGFAVAAASCALVAGFLAGVVRTAQVMHVPVLPPAHAVRLTGFVEQVEKRPKSDRILLRLDPGAVRGLPELPQLVRLSLRKGSAPAVGDHITQLARLLPPMEPAMPGSHDFGRGPWFRGIGAIGFGLGAPKITSARDPPLSVRLAMAVDAVRASFAHRIRASLTGTPAEIAIALVAGDRAGIPPAVEESMRVSGLTHILSISGLHMALVAGTLFALVRAGLALVPGLALGGPIKAIAAVVALLGSAGYLVLSGNDVPAQRSFVMTALVLGGVLLGRRALTLRTVAVAALVVLGLTPEAVLEPGTQMSFMATLALVAAYERLHPLRALPHPAGRAARTALAPLLFLAGIAVTALVAGLASGPYGAFHFQRMAPYGLLANLIAMPAVSLLVMLFGLIGVLLMPFGLDHLAWPVMGWGIEIMVGVSDWITRLPGADARFDGVNTVALLCFSLGLIILCLLRGLLTALAVPFLALAVLALGPPPRADLLVAGNGSTVAVRGPDGRLSIIGARTARLVAEQWMEREGDRRGAAAPELAAAFRCDGQGCAAPLPDGSRIAVSRQMDGLAADCLNARIVVTKDQPPAGCPARVLNPERLARTGTLAFFWRDGRWQEVATLPADVDRPWMRPRPPAPADDGPTTPSQPDLSADDAAAD